MDFDSFGSSRSERVCKTNKRGKEMSKNPDNSLVVIQSPLRSALMAPSAPTRAPRPKPGPYKRKPKPKVAGPKPVPPRTTAKVLTTKRQNLTLADWLSVFKFVDERPDMSQAAVVQHFKTKKDGALFFDQATLSRKLQQREELEKRAKETPNALSMKRARIVTEPRVEHGLLVWIRHMNARGETVTGPMMVAMRGRLEDRLDVPEEKRMISDGWVAPFCKAYGIKQYRRHGEAGSVDPEAVKKETERVLHILATYSPKDCYNFDETGFFPL
jgi:hypothetical protein